MLDTLEAKAYIWINQVQNFWVKIIWIETFWKTKRCSDISNNRLDESEHPFRPESAWSSRRSNTSVTTGFPENLRGKNKSRPIIAQLSINSLRNKFVFMSSQKQS